MAISLVAALLCGAQQVSPAPEHRLLQRAYTLGAVGDHDGDSVADYALAGGRDPIVVRVFSGADDHLITEYPTPVQPACQFVLHAAHVRVVADLDGDGVCELSATDGAGWLLEGRTGTVICEMPARTGIIGTLGDVDGDGCADPIVTRADSHDAFRFDPAARCAAWSGRDLCPIQGWLPPSNREQARCMALLDGARAFVDAAGFCDGLVVELIVDECADENWWIGCARLVARTGTGKELFDRRFELPLADDEYGGCGEFRAASPTDLDGDGLGDLVVALPAHSFWRDGSFVGALSSADGRVLWRSENLRTESLNPSVDLLPDRDGDGTPELLAAFAGGSGETTVFVLSGRSGAVLARFEP